MSGFHAMPGVVTTVMGNADVTVCTVAVTVDGEVIQASGSARRDGSDRFDREIGIQLATGRALQSLGRRLERRGNGLVAHRDWVRADRNDPERLRKKRNWTRRQRNRNEAFAA